MRKRIIGLGLAISFPLFAAEIPERGVPAGCDGSVMSEKYWQIWNAEEQAKIDADIEANRKADGVFAIDAPIGTEVKVEQIDSDFKFGAHIFNFNPEPGKLRAQGEYEDSQAYWNSLSQEQAMLEKQWRRPAPGPVIDFLKYKDVRIHGHILIWGSAKPYWIYDWFCPENEKRNLDLLSIPRHSQFAQYERAGTGENFGYQKPWCQAWAALNDKMSEEEIAAQMPVFTKEMRRIFRKRLMDVGRDFGAVVDSWDVVSRA